MYLHITGYYILNSQYLRICIDDVSVSCASASSMEEVKTNDPF